MNRTDAIAVVTSFCTDVQQAINHQSIEQLFRIAQERTQLLMDAGMVLSNEVESVLGEQVDGPITRLLQSFWLYFKATVAINTVNDILNNAAAAHAAAQQQQGPDGAFAALDKIADETLGKR